MSTKRTVGEVLKDLERLQLKGAVLHEAIEHLAKFVVTDSYEPKQGISSPLSVDVVPQDVIEEVRDELFVMRMRFETESLALKDHFVAGTVRKQTPKKKTAKKTTTKKKAITKKKAAKRAPPKRRKPSAQRKKEQSPTQAK